MLSNVDLPNRFWVEALAAVVHLINRSPNKVLDTKFLEDICVGIMGVRGCCVVQERR